MQRPVRPNHGGPWRKVEGAGAHGEAGAASLFSQRVFDWLDEVLARTS
ncbi:MAG: hypothetical protein AB7R89_11760 [Dehalococcoidia bacterium]